MIASSTSRAIPLDGYAHPGRVLIIAGSDSGGGAGLQGDLKTVTMLGGYGATAVTALTAQNTQGVFGIHDVPELFIEQQIRLVLEDIGADAIKTGMLHKASVIKAVAHAIRHYAPVTPLVADPVMFAKGGAALLEEEAVQTLAKLLFPMAALVTPNIPEAERLSGVSIRSIDTMREAAQRIRALGAKAVLVKGGHLPASLVHDVLLLESDEFEVFTSKRLQTRHTHGTGCALASGIATGLAQGMTLSAAVKRARDFVHRAIEAAPGYGSGHGPLGHHLVDFDCGALIAEPQ